MEGVREARRNLHRALEQLYVAVQRPSRRVLADQGHQLSASTVHNLLDPDYLRLARWETIDAFVSACENYARTHRPRITVPPKLLDRDWWLTMHRAAEIELAPELATHPTWSTRLIGVIPAKANAFQHRAEARSLDGVLPGGGSAVSAAGRAQVLSGLGGVGKTQLAADYARRSLHNHDVDLLLWITATSREAILARYAEAVSSVIGGSAVGSAEQVADRFLAWLHSTDQRWLVVLDDLSVPQDLSGLWPPQTETGRTIVTTRWWDAVFEGQGRQLVEVGLFTADEAAMYLSAALTQHPALADDVDGVAEALGYLPLALSHAAAYMVNSEVPCSRYRRLVGDQRVRLPEVFADEAAIPDNYRRTIARTWLLSIEAANQLAPRGLAKPLLQMASVLDPNGVPERVFTTAAARDWLASRRVDGSGDEISEDAARKGLRCLRRLSLAAVDGGTVRVHALVQRATRDQFGEAQSDVLVGAARALDEVCATVKDADWRLFVMLVKVADAAGDNQRKRDIFGHLLDMLDRKYLDDWTMARSWDATYVLQHTIQELLPLVLECLDGEQVRSVESPDSPRASRIGTAPQITQETASSLASVFPYLDDWRAALPERAVPILRRGLARWPLRKRFVEALAVYRHPDALDAILAFAREELDGDADRVALDAAAVALGQLGGAFGDGERAACVTVLSRIAALDGRLRKTVRSAINARVELTRVPEEPPPIDEAEIITYLSPTGDRGRASDWADVQTYAEHVDRHLAPHGLSPALVEALLQAFCHPHPVVRIAVAKCFRQLDDPATRDALERQLRQPAVPADLRQACFDALIEQAARVPPVALRAARRWQALYAASLGTDGDRLGLTVRVEASDPLVTLAAFGITPLAADLAVSVRAVPADEAPMDERATSLVTPDDVRAVGQNLEPKYRICSITQPGAASLTVTIAETTWQTGAAFHRALRRARPLPAADHDVLLRTLVQETGCLPNIAVVHCVLFTQEQAVVAVRRPSRTLYSAGRWSVSYEEQLTTADLADEREDPFSAAARRGYAEEFGLPAEELRIRIVGAIVETEILNRALLAMVETHETVEVLRQCAGRPEIDEIRIITGLPEVLRHEAERADLHPTAALRLHLLVALCSR